MKPNKHAVVGLMGSIINKNIKVSIQFAKFFANELGVPYIDEEKIYPTSYIDEEKIYPTSFTILKNLNDKVKAEDVKEVYYHYETMCVVVVTDTERIGVKSTSIARQ